MAKLWHPDDPVVWPTLPRGHVPPGGEPMWETILAFPIRLWRWAFMGQNIRGRFYRPPLVESPPPPERRSKDSGVSHE